MYIYCDNCFIVWPIEFRSLFYLAKRLVFNSCLMLTNSQDGHMMVMLSSTVADIVDGQIIALRIDETVAYSACVYIE